MTWTTFWDMHSGGDTKEPPFQKIYIEAPEDEARSVFYARFGHNPSRVTCPCCGPDYSIYVDDTLEEATKYHRRTYRYGQTPVTYMSLEEYLERDDVLVIRAETITAGEAQTEVPEEGYVWM